MPQNKRYDHIKEQLRQIDRALVTSVGEETVLLLAQKADLNRQLLDTRPVIEVRAA